MGTFYSHHTGYFIVFDTSMVTKRKIDSLQKNLDPNNNIFECLDNFVISILERRHHNFLRYSEIKDDLPLDHNCTFGFKELTGSMDHFSPKTQDVVNSLLEKLPNAKLLYGSYTYLC